MIGLRKSKFGFIISGFYLVLAAVAFGTHIYSVETNSADSGLSALWFALLAMPWIQLIPDSLAYSPLWGLLVYPVCWLMVALNAFILYVCLGGIRVGKSETP